MSRGRYIAFLDCDDLWLPSVPSRAVRLLDRYPEIDVLFADAQMGNLDQGYVSWIERAGQDAFFELPHREPEPGFRILERGPFFRRTAERSPLFIGAMIMRREAFEQAGGFDPALCGAADWELWLRMATRCTFAFLAEPLAVYTRHLDNMSSDHDRMVGEFCQALRNVRTKCVLQAEDSEVVRQRLRHESFHHAYLAYDAGRYAEARSRFRTAIAAGDLRPITFALFAMCCLPGGVIRSLRRTRASHSIDSSPNP